MPSLLSLIRAVLVLSVLQPFLAAAQNDGTVSIHDTNGYTSLRECARRIVSEDDWLKAGLSCPAPYYNFCYCRSDLGSVATAYISSCVFTDCRYNSADLTSVVGLYDAYCATATLSPGTTPKATTTSIGPGGTPVVVIPTTVIVETGKSPGRLLSHQLVVVALSAAVAAALVLIGG